MGPIRVQVLVGVFIFVVTLILFAMASYLNVKHAQGPKERRFVVRACVSMWTLIIALLLSLTFLPQPYNFIAMVLIMVIFPLQVYRWSTMHQLIRHIDEIDAQHEEDRGGA